jgi:uncharacterized metal-binding protein
MLSLDGCPMTCGLRLLAGAMPEAKAVVVFTDGLYGFDRTKFSIDQMSEEGINRHARTVAEKFDFK